MFQANVGLHRGYHVSADDITIWASEIDWLVSSGLYVKIGIIRWRRSRGKPDLCLPVWPMWQSTQVPSLTKYDIGTRLRAIRSAQFSLSLFPYTALVTRASDCSFEINGLICGVLQMRIGKPQNSQNQTLHCLHDAMLRHAENHRTSWEDDRENVVAPSRGESYRTTSGEEPTTESERYEEHRLTSSREMTEFTGQTQMKSSDFGVLGHWLYK